ncbi:response regulator transcription factor [Paenibacillus sp. JX-17]|uniref:Response regulator transcription factor n=1 Tax=Paenibacillus lacisoli TaxID=3064525 RepID=A0ABT9CMD2_9BACL|nr:response regulator transcription factor [Paenibacillus sp. JX-17]MDO7908801.1 response regulator transcription factor [Paenibacillus sp. JX-17]
MTRTILLVDDDADICALIKLFLDQEGYETVTAADGIEALAYLKQQEIHLAVVDLMMPRMNGIELLQQLRTIYRLPVIVLSAKSEDSDKILGLRLGADDFITKPFNPLEVVARIHAMLRRTYDFNVLPSSGLYPQQLQCGDLLLDQQDCLLYRKGTPVPLTAIEYRLMQTLMSSPGRVFTKKQLFEQVWSETYAEDANTIMVHISRLRDKVEDSPREPVYIQTIRGLGYKFTRRAEQP